MRRAFWPLVLLCALIGLTARLWNLDFDQRQHLHPDERFWALTADALARTPAPAAHGTLAGPLLDWLDGQRSPADPYRAEESFLYGPLPLTLARETAGWLHAGVVGGDQPASLVAHAVDALGVPLIDDAGAPRFDAGYGVDLIGRLIGALFDTATIVVIALIARRIAGQTAGVIAAGLYALSVLAIQHAHFLGAEPLLGLACASTVWATLRLDRSADSRAAARRGALVGLFGGLAIAVKLTGVGLVAVPVVGCLALAVRHRRRSDLVRLGAIVVGACVAFRIFDPSAFNGLGLSLSKAFTDDLQRAGELSTSTAPPSFQWANRTPILQPIVWLSTFTVGPGIVLAAGLGGAALGARLFGVRIRGWLGLDRRGSRGRRLAEAVSRRWSTDTPLISDVGVWPMLVIGGATVFPFAYIAITSLPTGRYFIPMLPGLYSVAAVGVAAAIRVARRRRDTWRGLALGFVAITVGLSAIWGIAFVHGVYGRTNTRIDASRWIEANVPAGSVLSSEAWDDGLPLRLPGLDADVYSSEELNLVGPDDEAKVATLADQLGRIDYVVESSARIWGTVTRMPARFPSTINFFDGLDSGTLGFQRVATFKAGLSLGPWSLDDTTADEAFSVFDHPEVRIWHKVRTLDRNVLIDVLDPVAAANAVPVDPNRAGANGLMLEPGERATNSTGPTYDQAFDVHGSNVVQAVEWFLLLELLGLAAFALFLPLLRRLPDAGLGVAKTLALTTLAFVIFVSAAWMHVDLDRTVCALAIGALLAAGAVRGWRQRDELLRLWRDRRPVLIAVEALGIAMFLAFVIVRAMNPDLWHPDRGGEKPFEIAFLTAVLRTKTLPVYDPWYSGGAMNYYYGGWLLLSAPARLLRTSPALVMNLAIGVIASCTSGAAFSLGAALVDARWARWRRPSRTRRTTIVAGVAAALLAMVTSNGAIVPWIWRWLTGSLARGPIVDWWSMSRVIPGSVAITEFPAWSFLFGDVHPHLMGIAPLLAIGTLCVAWYIALRDGRRGHAIALAALLGIGVGIVRMTNTWDFPLAVGLTVLTLVTALVARVPWRRLLIPGAIVAFFLVVVWSPYTGRGEVFDSGFDPAYLRTPPSNWFEQFGLFAVLTALVLLDELSTVIRLSRTAWGTLTNAHLAIAGLSLAALGYLALRPGFETFEMTAVLALGCAWLGWRRWRADVSRRRLSPLGALTLAIGWSIQAGVEMFTVRNDAGRMNTVFKFWYESWVVLAVGAAVVLAEQLTTRRGWRRRVGAGALAVTLAMVLGFWALATPVRMDDRVSPGGLSLAGESYLSASFAVGADDGRFVPADDLPLIDWLRANVHGIQVVAEASGDDYRWAGRVSWMTGLPTPIGWSYHESQQRRPYAASIDVRHTDMAELYTTTDDAEIARILSRYSIAYLVFGTQEQLLSSPLSESTLRDFPCLDVTTSSARSTENSPVADELYVAVVDQKCVSRLRPALAEPPPTS